MTKLHEVLAVESSKETIAKKIIAETQKNFASNHNLFQGFEKTLSMKEDGQTMVEEAARESRTLETTVPRRLDYTAESVTDWLDVVLQKETTNATAFEDLVVENGEVLATAVPVTFLLGLETKLTHLRKMYDAIPTLPPGSEWETSDQDGADVYRLKQPEIKTKTAKTVMHKILVAADAKHPAQVEKWNEDVVVGKFSTTYKLGVMSAADKAVLLGRVDKLLQATKAARMRANMQPVIDCKIGAAVFSYLHG